MAKTTATAPSTCKPLWRTPQPSPKRGSPFYVPGVWFDQEAVDRVLRAMRSMRHSKGRWAGVHFEPEPWQVEHIIAPAFGWKHPDGTRVVREVWVELPRKNGKSTLAAALALVLLVADGEMGAEVYSAATGKDQARIVFSEAKNMGSRTPALKGKLRLLADVITVPKTAGIYRVLSKVADAAHGLNVSGYTIDEVHVHRSRELIDVITTGTGAREQPLGFFLTTADDDDPTSIYAEYHDDVIAQAEQVEAGTVPFDPTFYGVIFGAPDEADPFDERTWEAANPGLDVTVLRPYLAKQAAKAKRTPSFLPTFCRLHLNQRGRSNERWLPLDDWRGAGGTVPKLDGERCFGGLDLSSTDDLTAWLLVFPRTITWRDVKPHQVVEGYDVLARFWLPRAAVERRPKLRPMLEAWERAGWLTVTDGDVVDFDRVEHDIGVDAERFDVVEFAYDPWQAENLRQRLLDGGLLGWKCSQRMASMAAPSQEVERLVGLRGFRHGGNPVLTWCVANAKAKRDTEGNVKPDKAKSSEKIDGVTALVMATGAAIRERDPAMPAPSTATGTDGGDVFAPSGKLSI